MTPASRLMAAWPALLLVMALALLIWVLGPAPVLAMMAVVYLLPLACWRLHQRLAPVREGVTRLRAGPYSAWWGGQQIQWWFTALPALEEALRAVPGLYSAWLRAWGSDIGRGVYWTPGLRVADRGLLCVGDGVVFGYGVHLTSHIVKPTQDGDLLCVVRRVHIGAGAFIGAGAVIAAGTRVDAGAIVPAGTRLVGARVRRDSTPGPGAAISAR